MSIDFKSFSIGTLPYLDRIPKEARLGGDSPRRQRYVPLKPVRKESSMSSSENAEMSEDNSVSGRIDLRA